MLPQDHRGSSSTSFVSTNRPNDVLDGCRTIAIGEHHRHPYNGASIALRVIKKRLPVTFFGTRLGIGADGVQKQKAVPWAALTTQRLWKATNRGCTRSSLLQLLIRKIYFLISSARGTAQGRWIYK
jgi:hypothetical protein